MNKFKLYFSLILICTANFIYAQNIYLNVSKPIDERVSDLVSKLTLDEKVHQMMNSSPAIP
ncbi:MAG TPA: hypothetical protein VIJ27_04460, partial [Mucilaginibacter sp.]